MIAPWIRVEKRAIRHALATAASFGGLILAVCAAEAGVQKGLLETSAGRYEFTPTTCAIYSQDGDADIEIQGKGTAPNGEKFFIELSSTANAMTIGLGADGPFANPERMLKAGRVASKEFAIVASGRQLSVASLALVDENGASIDDRATLSIDCSTP